MKKWFCMEEIPRVHPMMIDAPMRAFSEAHKFGIPDSTVTYGVVLFEGYTCWLYFLWKEFHETGRRILKRTLANPAQAERLNRQIVEAGYKYYDFAEEVNKMDLKNYSNKELGKIYDKLFALQERSHGLGLAWVVLEFEHQLFTKHLLDYLKARIKESGKDYAVGEVFSVLSTPLDASFAQKEEKSLLNLAVKIQANERVWRLFIKGETKKILERLPKLDPVIDRALQKHYENFTWLPFMYMGPAWPKAYFVEVLTGFVKQNADVKPLAKKARERRKLLLKDQKRYYRELKVDERHQRLFKIAQGMVFTKAFRKD